MFLDPNSPDIFFRVLLGKSCNEHPESGIYLLDLRNPAEINRDSIKKFISASEPSKDMRHNTLSMAIYSLNLDKLGVEESLNALSSLDVLNENVTSKVHTSF